MAEVYAEKNITLSLSEDEVAFLLDALSEVDARPEDTEEDPDAKEFNDFVTELKDLLAEELA